MKSNKIGDMTPTHQNGGTTAPLSESQALLGALSSKRDSTYSSMSEQSGRTSPTNSCRVSTTMVVVTHVGEM